MAQYLDAAVGCLERMARTASQKLAELAEKVRRLEDRMPAIGGGGGGGGGSSSGVYFCHGLTIGANSSGTGEVFQSWDGTSIGTKDIHNVMMDACTGTKRQLVMRNPDGSYTVIAESCSVE